MGACTQSKSRDIAQGRAHLSLVQMELTGKNAEQFLERVVVADAQNLPAGSCMLYVCSPIQTLIMPTYCLLFNVHSIVSLVPRPSARPPVYHAEGLGMRLGID